MRNSDCGCFDGFNFVFAGIGCSEESQIIPAWKGALGNQDFAPTRCEYWAFKYVDLATVLAIKPPPGAKGHSREMDHARYPAAASAPGLVEGDIISTTGWIHLIAAEADGDYHIQIAGTDKSMARCFIVEAPRPAKKFVKDDRVLQATASVRQALLDKALGGNELKYGATKIINARAYSGPQEKFCLQLRLLQQF